MFGSHKKIIFIKHQISGNQISFSARKKYLAKYKETNTIRNKINNRGVCVIETFIFIDGEPDITIQEIRL